MKRAFIVEYNIRTRVVVDVPEYYIADSFYRVDEEIIKAASDKIKSDVDAYIIGHNCVSIEDDIEEPYDDKYDK